jgi:protein ImuB
LQKIASTTIRPFPMLFACIFVPDFAVEALLRAEPELRSQAVAVLEGKPPLQKVYGENEHARRAGIEPGMTKLQVEPCPQAALRVRSPLQESSAHAALLDCAQSFSPRVEDTACDTILLDLAGLEPLFGPPAKIARDLARRASDLGLETNVAVASNPDAAMVAARGFAGITVISPGREAQQLSPLGIEVLFPERSESAEQEQKKQRLLHMLEGWGVRHLRGLALLPDIALGERMGQEGVRLQQLARGNRQRTLVPVDPPLVFEEAIELDYPVVLLEPLAFLLSRLLEHICSRLSARALATQELRLTLELERSCASRSLQGNDLDEFGHPSNSFHRTLRLPVPLLDPKVFLKLLQLDLKAHPPGAPILKVHLAAEPVHPRAAQAGLFTPPSPEPEKLELTLAKISGLVGEEKVGCAELLDTHRADAFRMRRFAIHAAATKSRNGHGKNGSETSPTPQQEGCPVTALRMFRPPALAVVTIRDGKPFRIACPKKKDIQGEVLWTAGPWRSSGDWWEQPGWSRDEWDIALQTKAQIALYRLVHDLLSGRWHVEGTYD